MFAVSLLNTAQSSPHCHPSPKYEPCVTISYNWNSHHTSSTSTIPCRLLPSHQSRCCTMKEVKGIIDTFLRNIKCCLRHSYGTNRPVLSSFGKQTWTQTLAILQPNQDNSMMDVSFIWRRRLRAFSRAALHFAWVIIIYLSSELIIWGLSRTLAGVHLEFFASILGMVLTFALMTIIYLLCRTCDDIYQEHIKSKVLPTLPSRITDILT